jgi:peptidoglycan/LPS O-acetylase OafA/YrhL
MSVLLILAAIAGDPAKPGLLKSAPLAYLGRISFGLYVVHQGVWLFATRLGFPFTPAMLAVRWLLAFGGSVVVAGLSYRFLEGPFLKLKGRFTVVRSREE